MSACGSSIEVQHVAAGENHRERLHPLAGGAVFERGRACGIGREGPADKRAAKGRRRRIVPACSREYIVQLDERHSGPNPHAIDAHGADGVEPPRAHQRLAHRCRSAGQRRLGADRKNTGGASQNGRNVRLRCRREQRRRMAARKVRGILEVAGKDVGVVNGDRI